MARPSRRTRSFPLGQPEIEVTKLEDGEVVEFTAEVDVRPDFDLPDVSAISVEVPAVEVPDEDVDERVETLRQRFATNTEVERAAAKDDLVTIDLAGTRDGEARRRHRIRCHLQGRFRGHAGRP